MALASTSFNHNPAKKLVVIGGGAAGFFCAVNAARIHAGLQVVLVEKSSKLLSKVRVSGGGRCNVTHSLFDIVELSKRYPRGQNFVKKAFHRFSSKDTISWFKERRVELKTESDGRMFPLSDSSETIINCLLQEANAQRVDIRLNTEIKSIKAAQGKFALTTGSGQVMDADFVCIACGGYPKEAMFNWLQDLGHSIAAPLPSLFTFNLPRHSITALMGVSVPFARVKIEGTKLSEEGPVLITHWGLSGPAVLRLSAWGARDLADLNYQFRVHIHWCPAFNEQGIRESFAEARRQHATRKVSNFNMFQLPARLWNFLLGESGISEEMRFSELPAQAQNLLIRNLFDYTVSVAGKTTFKEEFVTAGGVKLSEVDPNTMMSRIKPNLFFAGEILDVDGITGGFNFQHAWTSGWIAANSISVNQS